MNNNRKDVIISLQMLINHFNDETKDVPSAVALSFILKDVQQLLNELADTEVENRAKTASVESIKGERNRNIVSGMEMVKDYIQHKLRWYADKDVISKSELLLIIDKCIKEQQEKKV